MANNPYVNKVVYGGTTLIDLTSDTVDAAHLAQGYTAHDRSGAAVTGLLADGDNLGYGRSTSPIVGAGRVGYIVLPDGTSRAVGAGVAGSMVI